MPANVEDWESPACCAGIRKRYLCWQLDDDNRHVTHTVVRHADRDVMPIEHIDTDVGTLAALKLPENIAYNKGL